MGRTKQFSREQVLERALAVFWKHGFPDTSLRRLERATGVNKSGLYSEFRDKSDLFLQSLTHYLNNTDARAVLLREPLGLSNVGEFLRLGKAGCGTRGCFAISSLREGGSVPPRVRAIVDDHLESIETWIADNYTRAGATRTRARTWAALTLTFNAGLCVEAARPKSDPFSRIDAWIALIENELAR